jgi:hypothetical protein
MRESLNLGKHSWQSARALTFVVAIIAIIGGCFMSLLASQLPPAGTPELEEFVFHPDQFQKEAIPRRLRPEDVGRFLLTRLDRTTGLEPLRQAEKLIDFYDLYEVTGYLRGFLDGRESTPDQRRRSITITRAIARSGTPDDQRFAAQYYRTLLQHATAPELSEMASISDALGPAGETQTLRAAASALLASHLPPNEMRTAQNVLTATVPRVEQANAAKARILAIPDRVQRIANEIGVYLGLVLGYPEYLPAWAARRLRRETWADQPAQQTLRAPDRIRSEQLAAAFRHASAGVEQEAKLTEQIKSMKRLTCLRAIDFFGGALSSAEYTEMQQSTKAQFDVLSNF